jgi:hypothetical protein
VRATTGLAREMEHPGGEVVDSALRGDCPGDWNSNFRAGTQTQTVV